MNIEITNLDMNLIESDLQRLFTPYGELGTVQIIRDHWNNRSKGRATVDMPVEKEAQQAVLSLNGVLLGTKKIIVTAMPYSEPSRNRNFMA
jgi:RNA recognition motif-containing protein